MDHYIGMDAHSKTSTFVVVDAKGKELLSQKINTSEREIEKFLGSIKGTKHLTFEESQLSRWLHMVLKDQVDELLVCNPCFIAKRRGPKNDYADAQHLAQQLRDGFLTPVFHDESFYSDLRRIVNAYENIVADHIRTKNRYKSLFIARAINVDDKNVFEDKECINLLDTASQLVARKLFKQIEHLAETRLEYKQYFELNKKQQKEVGLLATIPGISAIRANIIAAAVCDARRFANKNKFWSYCMLVKHDQQSDGKSYGKVHIFGKMSLKNVFMGAAMTVVQNGSELKRVYDDSRVKGLDHKAARKNLARHIAAVALAVMRTGKPYQERRVKKIDETTS
ncbi:MAG: IS110 family transposase [Pseudobdellovibrionaceae bacterium]